MTREHYPLITKYRPRKFKEMIGHEDVIRSLLLAMSSDTCPHAYLLTGGTGLGKTTLARLIGRKVQAEVIEIDAASNNGIDAMRELVLLGQHMSLAGEGNRLIIIDECHTLTKPAWQVILKILEDAPEHLFIALCTTEFAKVPATVVGRCYHVVLKNLKDSQIEALLGSVIYQENWNVADDVFNAVVIAAQGSPRNALSLLDAVRGCADAEEAKRLIRLQDPSDDIIAMCRLLLKGGNSWDLIQKLLKGMSDDQIEELPIPIGRYMASVMKNGNAKVAARAWEILNALTFPVDTFDARTKVYVQLGRIVFGG